MNRHLRHCFGPYAIIVALWTLGAAEAVCAWVSIASWGAFNRLHRTGKRVVAASFRLAAELESAGVDR